MVKMLKEAEHTRIRNDWNVAGGLVQLSCNETEYHLPLPHHQHKNKPPSESIYNITAIGEERQSML